MVPPRGRLASRQTSVFVLFSRFLEMFMSGGGGVGVLFVVLVLVLELVVGMLLGGVVWLFVDDGGGRLVFNGGGA